MAARPFASDLSLSLLIHASIGLVLYWLLVVRHPALMTMELDLSQAPRVAAPQGKPQGRPKPARAWTAARKGVLAPAPARVTESAQEETVNPCPPPCPDTPGDFVPASQAASQPRWIEGQFTGSDYPRVAAIANQDGLVKLSVFIDAEGRVRDVRLLKGSYEALNEAALRKVRAARFEPARDASGRAIPVELILPIRFQLY
jgi:TonB family protein